jgi:hypothetical protein
MHKNIHVACNYFGNRLTDSERLYMSYTVISGVFLDFLVLKIIASNFRAETLSAEITIVLPEKLLVQKFRLTGMH